MAATSSGGSSSGNSILFNPLVALGAAGISRGLSTFLSSRAREKRRQQLRKELLETLRPGDELLRARGMGLSRAESFLGGRQVGDVFMDLSAAGVGQSSLVGPAALEAVSPILLAHQQQLQEGTLRQSAARRAILGATAPEGSPASDAFASFFGDTGDVFALQGGRALAGNNDMNALLMHYILSERRRDRRRAESDEGLV